MGLTGDSSLTRKYRTHWHRTARISDLALLVPSAFHCISTVNFCLASTIHGDIRRLRCFVAVCRLPRPGCGCGGPDFLCVKCESSS